jgi:single-stranded-DNA-specific exonuclease
MKLIEKIHSSRPFLIPKKPNPWAVNDMEKAAEKILSHAGKITVFGDYDCDGICAAVIMEEILRRLGKKVSVYLPRRNEGYGINAAQVEAIARQGTNMIVTVDNGTTANEAASAAKKLGMEFIVTDHHESVGIPAAETIVNPKLSKNDGFREYSGAGVAYLLASALTEMLGEPEPADLLDLVSLATVVDVCPIREENFYLARNGLLKMREKPRTGIEAIMDVKGYSSPPGGYALGWIVGPMVNVCGRMGDPSMSYEIIKTSDPQKAAELAEKINRLNNERQEAVNRAVEECLKRYKGETFPFFVGDWPHGIVGIAAGRVAEAINRPVLVGQAGRIIKASGRTARSNTRFSIFEAINKCQQRTGLLHRFGGHRDACGLSLKAENLETFRSELQKIADDMLSVEDIIPVIEVDGVLTRAPAVEEIEELDELEPFGNENPQPVFMVEGNLHKKRNGDTWILYELAGIEFFANTPLPEGYTKIPMELYINEFNGMKKPMGRPRFG